MVECPAVLNEERFAPDWEVEGDIHMPDWL